MTVKAGRPLTIEVPYDAYPAPMMSWSKDGQVIEPGPDDLCQLSIDAKKCRLNM